DRVEELLAPIRIDGRADALVARLRTDVAAHLAPRGDEVLDDRLQVRRDAGAIDEDRFGRAADARAAQLGVLRDAPRHFEIGAGVHIRVADALEMAPDRHARVLEHA